MRPLTRDLSIYNKFEFEKPSKDFLRSADAIIGEPQTKRGFDYLVFVIHKNGEIRETLVFKRSELKELRPRIIGGKPSYRICRVVSIEKWQKYKESYNSQYSIYDVERDMVAHPENYLDKWDKIK